MDKINQTHLSSECNAENQRTFFFRKVHKRPRPLSKCIRIALEIEIVAAHFRSLIAQ